MLDLQLVGDLRALLDNALGIRILEVGIVLFPRRYPPVSDQQTLEVPLCLGCRALVAVENVLRDVRDMLTGI